MDSPKDYGWLHPSNKVSTITIKWDPTIFKKWGEIEEEDLYKMLYREPEEEYTKYHIAIPFENYGKV